MRRIAIVGSGITGCIAAHGLLRHGFDVTLFSDRTPAAWLNDARPTGTAARFDLALSCERELGLNHWDDVAPKGEGVFLTFCPTLHNPLLHLIGRQRAPFQAVDVRLQSARWMTDFAERGGRLVVRDVSVDELDRIAADHDLTMVATGRGELCRLFARDDARSPCAGAQRELAMVIVTGCPDKFNGAPLRPVRFELLGTDGEVFIVPYFHKDAGASWNIVVEAKPGSRMDRFRNARSGLEVLRLVRAVVTELFPWDAGFVANMQLADPNGWLVGRVAPTVRRPSAVLPSGRVVAALGDTAMSYDPIAAQGANSGVKQATHLVESIVRNGDAPFNRWWIDATFDEFWAEHGRPAMTFSSLLLEPITAAAKEILIAQHGSDGRLGNTSAQQQIADGFFENFNDPRLLTPAFQDVAVARAFIAKHNDGRWFWNGVKGRASIAAGQVRQRLGMRQQTEDR